MLNTITQRNAGRKGFICLYFQVLVHPCGELSGELTQRPWRNAALWLAQIVVYNPGIDAQGWYHLQWAGPSRINYQSRKCTKGQSDGNTLSVDFPFSKMTLACVYVCLKRMYFINKRISISVRFYWKLKGGTVSQDSSYSPSHTLAHPPGFQ